MKKLIELLKDLRDKLRGLKPATGAAAAALALCTFHFSLCTSSAQQPTLGIPSAPIGVLGAQAQTALAARWTCLATNVYLTNAITYTNSSFVFYNVTNANGYPVLNPGAAIQSTVPYQHTMQLLAFVYIPTNTLAGAGSNLTVKIDFAAPVNLTNTVGPASITNGLWTTYQPQVFTWTNLVASATNVLLTNIPASAFEGMTAARITYLSTSLTQAGASNNILPTAWFFLGQTP